MDSLPHVTLLEGILYWLIAANFIGFMLMLRDKHRAETGGWRTPESTLILWSLIGGSLGTLAAQRLLRHKTRKQPIATYIVLIPLFHGLCLAAYWFGLFPSLETLRALTA